MDQDLLYRLSAVTEAAALAGYAWLGRGDKNAADQAAVVAMRDLLNQSPIDGRIVIGEGEIDEAPMLYIGEHLGRGGVAVDIAVDPIEGTRMTAMGQANALVVLAAGARGSFLSAPDMYMEKLVVGQGAKGSIDLQRSLADNARAVAKALGKPLSELTVATLAKPRHEAVIAELHRLGARVFAFPDGDVAASVLACLPDTGIDMMYCIGGAPEGVISAAVARSLGGDMQGRLLLRSEAKGASPANDAASEQEARRCREMGVVAGAALTLEEMVRSDDIAFLATGITGGELLEGVRRYDDGRLTTETLVICGHTKAVRRIRAQH
ncbi:fructose-bisphosphatase class II [Zobellella denitrificans]|uniref:class II fructose-bisphosphatase n=1 Tax=Zobellella denitrificans TaxID=347534 RepID=UPI000B8C1B49|nr:class II fructose-bisphosphatase [Zobellella denitrificans]OXS16533.1 fructose-bisphosphatase class II [Zobellella denitrificans]